jgi:hypothetical protein
MDREYEIFEKSSNGSVQWQGMVSDLEEAIAKTNALAKLSSNEFYILSTDTREIVHRVEGTKPAPSVTDAEPERA